MDGEDVLAYLSFLQEVTNAYATALIWILALALGLTCLYIWRVLGLQEAARKHSQMVSSRPVFTTVPTQSTKSISSTFQSAYKNRFAHRKTGQDEQRLNAVGYDVLHTYDLSPCPRRAVFRALWKRHSNASDHEQTPQVQTENYISGNRLWGGGARSAGPWVSHSKSPAFSAGDFSSCPGSNFPKRVPAQRYRRPEDTEVRDTPVRMPIYQPCLSSRTPDQLQKLHYEQTKQNQQMQNSRRIDNCFTRNLKHWHIDQLGNSASERPDGISSQSSDDSPDLSMYPVPLPKQSKVTVSQPVKLSKHLFMLQQAGMEMSHRVRTNAERRKNDKERGDMTEKAQNKALGITDHKEELTETSQNLPSMIKQSSSCNTKHKQRFSSGDHQVSESKLGMRVRDVERHPKGYCVHQKETTTEQETKEDQVERQSGQSQSCHSKRVKKEQELAEPLQGKAKQGLAKKEQELAETLRHKLFSQGSSLSQHKSVSVLEFKRAKSFFTDRQKMEQETSEPKKSSSVETLSSKSNKSFRRNSTTHDCRKRSKTTRTPEPQAKDSSHVRRETLATQPKKKQEPTRKDQSHSRGETKAKQSVKNNQEHTEKHRSYSPKETRAEQYSPKETRATRAKQYSPKETRAEQYSSKETRAKQPVQKKPGFKGKDPSHASKETQATEAAEKESYDSAVLRAIKDEEADNTFHEKNLNNCLNTAETSSETVESYSKKRNKKATGEDEHDQNTMHEAGRRLAKLRKRLEDSIQLIQKQPGLNMELLEMACSKKTKRQGKDEVKTIFMKEDVPELDSLCNNKNSQNITSPELTPQGQKMESKCVETTNASKPDYPQSSPKESNQTSQDVCDGEPNVPTEKAQTALQYSSVNVPSTGAIQGSRASAELSGGKDESFNIGSSYTAKGKSPTRDDKKAFSGKEKKNLPADNAMGNNIPISHTEKKQNDNAESKSHAIRFLSSSGKVLDEGSLEAILERQSKRREDLRQRKRIHIESVLAGITGRKDKPAENENQDSHQVFEAEYPGWTRENTYQSSEQQPLGPMNRSKLENNTNVTKETDSKQISPIIMDGTPFLVDPTETKVSDQEASKNSPDETCKDSVNEEGSTLIDMLDVGSNVSTRRLNYLKYEEPEVQLTKVDATKTRQSSEKRFSFVNGELTNGFERESSARRRVRWRRQAERAEKQRMEAVNGKTPPPVPPKMTRLNYIVDAEILQQHREAKNTESNQENNHATEYNHTILMNQVEDKNNASESHEPTNPELFRSTSFPSSRLVRGSLICPISENNAVLAAGETGLAKCPPENVEICEENSLTPSEAASVFDPKAQMEKEKEKHEAERALRANNREGMPSLQFRANIQMFERGLAEATVDQLNYSKVKASVKMVKDKSKAQRAQSASPERRICGRKKRSLPSPKPNQERIFSKEI